ncbi:MAG: ATP-dependent Clp protease ATP-binding subunit [Methylocystaceae bacterium]
MLRRFTQRAQRALMHAQEEARAMNHSAVGTEHILLGVVKEGEGIAARALINLNINTDKLREEIKRHIGNSDEKGVDEAGDLPITPRAKKVLNLAFDEARLQGVNYVGTEHLLLAVLREEESVAAQVLTSTMGIKLDDVRAQVWDLLGGDAVPPSGEEEGNENKISGPLNNLRRKTRSKTPTMDNYSRDLTAMARETKLDPVVGRDKEIERVIQVLSRRTKNNPVLIGDPGVGKTAIAEGLAQRIVEGKIPEILSDKRVIALDISSMVAGTKYRGEFEDRLTKIVNEIKSAGDIIVFIDELHTIVGAGAAEGAIDAANILKPSLARGEFQCVGATTIDEYRKHIEKDPALERRFQPITVGEPSVDEAIEILKGLRDRYEAHHGEKITDWAIDAAVRLSYRYISDRFLPDKAIDLMDEAGSRVRLSSYVLPEELKELDQRLDEAVKEKEAAIATQEYEKAAEMRDHEQNLRQELEQQRKDWTNTRTRMELVVEEGMIAEIVSTWTGIPVAKLEEAEADRLVKLEEVLHQRVIGQNEAVGAVARAVRRARAGLKDPKRPIGSFVFLGPTGVGKTELARALAEGLFGSEDALIRLDMSEYMEKHTVSRMVGAPPGYVGYDEGGQLTEKVRRKPYSVILLDEIEKAHPDVFNILLQVLEDGRLTDGQGRTVDFRNTVIIMTSNLGAESISRDHSLGFRSAEDDEGKDKYDRMKSQVMERIKHAFRPEFLNRLDEVIVFHNLTAVELRSIIDMMLAGLQLRLAEQGLTLEVTDSARDQLIKEGYDPQYGARPLRRAIQRHVEDRTAEELLKKTFNMGDTILIDTAEGLITVNKA